MKRKLCTWRYTPLKRKKNHPSSCTVSSNPWAWKLKMFTENSKREIHHLPTRNPPETHFFCVREFQDRRFIFFVFQACSFFPINLRIYIEDLEYNLIKIFDSDYKPTSNQLLALAACDFQSWVGGFYQKNSRFWVVIKTEKVSTFPSRVTLNIGRNPK